MSATLTIHRLRQAYRSLGISSLVNTAYIFSSFLIKTLYVTTCDCRGIGQVFNLWFFPSFHAWPYTSWFEYHGIRWLGGPYSLLWWGLNAPAFFGYWVFFTYLILVDLIFMFVIRKHAVWTIFYATVSVWFVTVDPVDFFVVLFIFAGRFKKSFLALAPLTKLPIGAPLSVWAWVLTSNNSLHGSENFGRYALLAGLWGIALLVQLRQYTNEYR